MDVLEILHEIRIIFQTSTGKLKCGGDMRREIKCIQVAIQNVSHIKSKGMHFCKFLRDVLKIINI